MDGRGRLAQAPKPKIKQRNAAAWLPQSHAWPASSSGWRRMAWRWWHALISFQAPRGASASAAALLLLASAVYGAVKGNHVPTIVAQVQDICDAAANKAGFGITEIALAGAHEVRRDDILHLAGITEHSSLLLLDAAAMRARLTANPWIAEATVLKLYPSQLRIEIKERTPFALWQKDGRVSLIASDGVVLESFMPPRFASLPQVVGKGAEKAAADFLELLARHPDIARLVEASVLVAERRWNLHLKGGLDVLLPESDAPSALTTLSELARDRQLLTRDVVAVDLRLKDRVTVRLSDTAAAAREEALKAANKDKKKKGGAA